MGLRGVLHPSDDAIMNHGTFSFALVGKSPIGVSPDLGEDQEHFPLQLFIYFFIVLGMCS